MPLSPGSRLGPYEILAPLGSGGMGEVYRARDKKLDRDVAIKVLPESVAADPETLARFEREAKAVAALSHQNILSIFDFGTHDGVTYAVTELLEGETLRTRLDTEPISQKQAVEYALQIAKGLSAAHEKGVVHRDLKPENLFVMKDGHLKILDFGLAKRVEKVAPGEETSAPTASGHTTPGTVLGTVGYMSPEQVRGLPVDHRSDIFSFGAILYELLSGKRAFKRDTPADTMSAILKEEPREPSESGRNVPVALDHVVRHCLEKDRDNRFQSVRDIVFALGEASGPTATGGAALATPKSPEDSVTRTRAGGLSLKSRIAVAVALVAVTAAAGGWFWHRSSRVRWALGTAMPEITRLVAAEEFTKAAALIREARVVLPKEPTLEKLWTQATIEVSVESVPAGADVSYRPYRADPRNWEGLGRTPLTKVRVPRGFYLWRIVKPGFIAVWQIAPTWTLVHNIAYKLAFRLDAEGSTPAAMVRVPGGKVGLAIPGLDQLPEVALDDYLIDQHEVTNEEYKKFVEADGYQKPDFWKQRFVKDGQTMPWEGAMAYFRDGTGRPGPLTWELGSFPTGLEKHPVAGVSWYEAAAYAEFAGKSLPTIYHWNKAAQTQASMLIAPGSNFQGTGTLPVGGEGAVSGFGTTDMAGNVKEWCWNESTAGKRFILGGGFGEPTYMFIDEDAQLPWDRRPNYGFRCVKLSSAPPPTSAARIEGVFRDFSKEKPVSDEVFRAYKGLYAYDNGELNARVEEVETTADWKREKVSFKAAYGGERVIAHLFLPKNAAPPYQTVVYFPGSGAINADKFSLSAYADFIPKSGRALMAPIYKSTFERRDELKNDIPETTALYRDHMIAWSKDLGRSLDYLETRRDIDHGDLAYLGLSWGSALAPILLAVEGRFKTAILESGGMEFQKALAEADQINFVSRVRIPVLMLNGRYDHFFPVESSQLPLFRLLGTPEKNKRHVIYETGHAPPRKEFIRESLDWLDKYLAPVKR